MSLFQLINWMSVVKEEARIMKIVLQYFLFLCSCLMFSGCSSEGDNNNVDARKDHVWKEQTDTIDKAKEVEGIIMDSAEETRKRIEQQGE